MAEIKKDTSIALFDKTKLNGETYAKAAETIMQNAKKKSDARERDAWFGRLSTSKIRGIYGLITNVYTRITDEVSFEENKTDLQYIKVKMAYECGRDRNVDSFIKGTGLMTAIDSIAAYDQFILYCRYAESLVAYFKFYGGKEN
jgi:CRISPR-associated protein Csm2